MYFMKTHIRLETFPVFDFQFFNNYHAQYLGQLTRWSAKSGIEQYEAHDVPQVVQENHSN